MSKFDHFPKAVDPVVYEKHPWLTPEEQEYCARVAAVMFMAWSGASTVIGRRVSLHEDKHRVNEELKMHTDLDEVILEQLKIMIWG